RREAGGAGAGARRAARRSAPRSSPGRATLPPPRPRKRAAIPRGAPAGRAGGLRADLGWRRSIRVAGAPRSPARGMPARAPRLRFSKGEALENPLGDRADHPHDRPPEAGYVDHVLAAIDGADDGAAHGIRVREDRKSTRLNSSHVKISYAVFCLKKKTQV